ncbi:MAG: carboxypeptidase-like regulatory domain-containing protein [Bacteroidales bacterium]|nr:carboxypeptidase-like regulatory domain-containing protein [Bacteroidales bacterium]
MFNNTILKNTVSVLLLLFFFFKISEAQQTEISGRITDAVTGEYLPFVNIVYNDKGNGTVSDIDGRFKFNALRLPDFLKFSYVGYETKIMEAQSVSDFQNLSVSLQPKAYLIDEIKVFPGINPAHRIINLASENRKINNPENLNSFSYVAYDKMHFTFDPDSLSELKSKKEIEKDKKKRPERYTESVDSSDINARQFIQDQHLFIMESIIERKFKKPDLNKEIIISSRVSGFEKPTFLLMATQFQSFSFYDDLIMVGGKKYLNPLSRGSTTDYFFLLEDTLYTERNDTVFIISYQPHKNKNFNGLKGILYINSNKYAIQNVIAEASNPEKELFTVKIQQEYQLVDNHWFPYQLNTNIIFHNAVVETSTRKMKLLGIGRSYILNVRINPDLPNKIFDEIALEINNRGDTLSPETWNAYRVDSLTEKDQRTYHIIDSIGKAEKFDSKFRNIETLLLGYIPLKYINLDLGSILDYNDYEGFRLGIGGKTNKNISTVFSLDGHVAYGFKDKALKYGAGFTLNLNQKHETFLKLSYLDDLAESGGYHFLGSEEIFNSESYRNYMLENMDQVVKKEILIGSRLLKFLTLNASVNQSYRTTTNDYSFVVNESNPVITTNGFQFTELALQFKYAFREQFMLSPLGNRFSNGTKYPVFYGNIIKGTTILNGNYEYLKVEAKITKSIEYKKLGTTRLQLVSGMASGDLPYPVLYNGHGSFKHFTLESENSFATMRMNEFLADRFVSLFVKHDFGNLFFHSEAFHPDFQLVNNISFGELKKPSVHANINFQTLNKGYYECGVLINNVLRQNIIGYGFGVFYRYGPYSFSQISDNFAYKLTFSFNL